MPAKKIFVALLIIAVAVGGFVAGLILLQQNQDIEEQASTPTGTATVSLNPGTGTYNVGDTISVGVYFNPSGAVISGVSAKMIYNFSGTTPEVTVASIEVNPAFISSGDWTCPTQDSSLAGNTVEIEIGCAYLSVEGFTANSDTLLANLKLNVTRAPQTSPFVILFDSAESIIKRKSDDMDILLTPTSEGSYTIVGVTEPSATPTSGLTGTVTPTPKLTTTLTPTVRPTGVLSPTPTPTSVGGTLPDAGVSLPTVFGVSFGILVIVGAVLLAL